MEGGEEGRREAARAVEDGEAGASGCGSASEQLPAPARRQLPRPASGQLPEPASGHPPGPASGQIEAGGGERRAAGGSGGQAAADPADGVNLNALALGLPECVICMDGDKTHLVRSPHSPPEP